MAGLDKIQAISIDDSRCPWCDNKGRRVPKRTVESLCPEVEVKGEKYYLCLSPGCDAGYYTSSGEVIPKDKLVVPVWFKEKSPVPVCYCQQVTDEEIWRHVAVDRCCHNLEDIQRHTGANTGCRCVEANPAGA